MTTVPWRRWVWRHPTPPWVIATGLFVGYATLSTARYLRFDNQSWDLGIFEQVVRSYANLTPPVADIKGPGFLILGDHFSPLLAVLAPLYRLFPSAITLLVAQAALFALSAVPVTRIAMTWLGRARGVAIGVAYGVSFGLQTAVDAEFHEIALAVPLLTLSLERLTRQAWRDAVLWCVPLVLVKEDLGLTVAAVGAYLVLSRQRWLGSGLVLFGLTCTLLAVLVILPQLNTEGSFGYWDRFSLDSSGARWWVDLAVSTPQKLVTPGVKIETVVHLLGITAFLALRSPLVLIALPTLGWRFLADHPQYWGIEWHYNAILMPIMFIAAVDGIGKAQSSPRPWIRAYARNAVPAILAIAVALSTHLPARDLLRPETYQPGPAAVSARKAMARIPDDATVESDYGLMAHLTGRTRVFWMGDTGTLTPDFIAFDTRRDPSLRSESVLEGYARQLHPSVVYEPVFADRHFAILRSSTAG